MRPNQLLFEFEVESNFPKPQPFLKWVGGKGGLLTQFDSLFPRSFKVYFEPFLGGGAVFFHLLPTRTVLNDCNPALIGAYRNLQGHSDKVIQQLYTMQQRYHNLTTTEQEAEYYKARERYNRLDASCIEKTVLLIFLNKTGYNGLYRENSTGGFNVPFGSYKNPSLFRQDNLKAIAECLQGVELLNTGFNEAVTTAQRDDFVYFDPPYVPLSRTASFTGYTKKSFAEKEQRALAHLVKTLTGRGVLVMVSNADTPFVRELYRNFHQHEVKAARSVNSKATLRGKISELVITNYNNKGVIQFEA